MWDDTARSIAHQVYAPDPELYPFASHHFERSGLRMHYIDEGRGDPVVLVHGNPTWSLYYRELARSLRSRFRVIAPDHIGCGLSDKPGDDRYVYRLRARIDDLEALLEDLGVTSRVTLVVHDWGGAIGIGWAARHPERLRRLVILNTAAFPLPAGKPLPWQLRVARDLRAVGWLVRGANAFARVATHVACKSMSPQVRRAYLGPYDSWANRIAILRFVQDIPLGPGDDSWPDLLAVHAGLAKLRDVPALICWGQRDFIFDATFLEQWKRELPTAEILELPDAGHFVLEDASPAIVARVEEFLDTHAIGGA
ncbi:MAG: alpha/beta fold hydrolase [Myxococcota bacterium]